MDSAACILIIWVMNPCFYNIEEYMTGFVVAAGWSGLNKHFFWKILFTSVMCVFLYACIKFLSGECTNILINA